MRTSTPGPGRPTVPSLNSSELLAVNAPLVSVMPYTSRTFSPNPAKKRCTSRGMGAAAVASQRASSSPIMDRMIESSAASARSYAAATSGLGTWPYCEPST